MIYGNSIIGIKKILDVHPDFKWNQLDSIIEFNFWIDYNEYYDEVGFIEVKFGLYSNAYVPYYVKLRFGDIEDVNLTSISVKNQLLGFEIVHKGQDGWQKNYWVNDYENSLIRFYCNSIEVIETGKQFD